MFQVVKKSSPHWLQGVFTGLCFQPHPLNNEAARPVDPAAGACAETALGRRSELAWVHNLHSGAFCWCHFMRSTENVMLLWIHIKYHETLSNLTYYFIIYIYHISYDFIRAPHGICLCFITSRHTTDARDFGVGVGQCCSTLPTSSWAACHAKYPAFFRG